jgi:hypothetical protein
LSRLFRRLFLAYLQDAFDAGKLPFFTALAKLRDRCEFARYLARLRKAEWVVYAKAPFAGRQQVLDYVGRYNHRVAVSNHRLLDIEAAQVRFQQRSAESDDAFCLGVHPPVSPPHFTRWLPAHSLLRLARQSLPVRKAGAMSPIAGHGTSSRNPGADGLPRPA